MVQIMTPTPEAITMARYYFLRSQRHLLCEPQRKGLCRRWASILIPTASLPLPKYKLSFNLGHNLMVAQRHRDCTHPLARSFVLFKNEEATVTTSEIRKQNKPTHVSPAP